MGGISVMQSFAFFEVRTKVDLELISISNETYY